MVADFKRMNYAKQIIATVDLNLSYGFELIQERDIWLWNYTQTAALGMVPSLP